VASTESQIDGDELLRMGSGSVSDGYSSRNHSFPIRLRVFLGNMFFAQARSANGMVRPCSRPAGE
jgi:hypothetical protein